jgi:hypothetical protein
MNDPYNTPFENWYQSQRMDPFSPVNMMKAMIRIILWCWLFTFIARVFFGRRSKAQNAEEDYYRKMQQEAAAREYFLRAAHS